MLTAVHTPGPKVYEGLRDQRVYAVGDWTPGGGLREGDSRCLREVGARDRARGARCQGDGGRGGQLMKTGLMIHQAFHLARRAWHSA